MTKNLTLPLSDEIIRSLHAGDAVTLSGVIYTARDCAHKKIFALLDGGEQLPFPLEGATVYYAGPCPAKPGDPIGSCGPTTSARMEGFAPRLITLGLKTMIGKGEVSDRVVEALKEHTGCYFAAVGGAGALYAKCVKKSVLVAFPELLSEAVYKLTVENFPAVVAVDSYGKTVYNK